MDFTFDKFDCIAQPKPIIDRHDSLHLIYQNLASAGTDAMDFPRVAASAGTDAMVSN